MAGKPYLPLYTGEWIKDEKLSVCEAATRGIFVDWLCHMHNGQVDRLTGTARQLGRLGRCDESDALGALRELQETRAADVSDREGVWTIVSRRRQREMSTSRARTLAGSKGLAKRWQNADIDIGNETAGIRIRIGNLFRRRETTPWSDKEQSAFARLGAIDNDDLALVESYYTEAIPKEQDYRRRDLLTLLNNWTGEVDRARLRKRSSRSKPLCSAPRAIAADTRTEEEVQKTAESVRGMSEELRLKLGLRKAR